LINLQNRSSCWCRAVVGLGPEALFCRSHQPDLRGAATGGWQRGSDHLDQAERAREAAELEEPGELDDIWLRIRRRAGGAVLTDGAAAGTASVVGAPSSDTLASGLCYVFTPAPDAGTWRAHTKSVFRGPHDSCCTPRPG
jgi:hypothetical protein